MPLEARHVYALAKLPGHHRDPFGRILAAQAMEENHSLVSFDAVLRKYPVEIVW